MYKMRWKQKLSFVMAGMLAVMTVNTVNAADVGAGLPNDIYLDEIQAQVNEASGTCGEHLDWTLDLEGILSITGTGGMFDHDASDRKAPWMEQAQEVRQVTIAEGVTSIGKHAFSGCNALNSISLPEGVLSIGGRAFDGCSRLSSVQLPESLESIAEYAFSNCSSLASISIPNRSCEIYDGEGTIQQTAVIHGYVDSTAQAYAEKYKREFVALEEVTPGPSEETDPSKTPLPSDAPTVSPLPLPIAPAASSKAAQKLRASYDPGTRQIQRTVGAKMTQKIQGAKTKVIYTSSNRGVAKITKVNCERGNWCEITCVGAGKTVITATAKEDSAYKAASISFTLYVSPKAAKVVSLRSDKKGQVTIKSNNAAKGSDGYQIMYIHNGKITKIQVKGHKPLTKTIKNLRSGKAFRVKIRTYKERKGEVYYGKYSAWKTLNRVR